MMHKPGKEERIDASSFYQETCLVCGATRERHIRRPFSSWMLNGKRKRICMGTTMEGIRG